MSSPALAVLLRDVIKRLGQISRYQLREQIGAGSRRRLEMLGYKHYVKSCSAFPEHVISQFNA